MGRIRTVKPEFFTSEDIVALSAHARLLYIALWCEADREGRLQWKPRTFKMRYFPADDVSIDSLCNEITSAGLAVTYGDGLAYIPSFKTHQHVNPRESASILPAPPSTNQLPTRRDASARVSDAQGGKEGEGKERKDLAPNGACPPDPEDPDGSEDFDLESEDGTYAVPDCPHAELVELYHEVLPQLPRCEVLNDTRRGYMRQRWREVCAEFKLPRVEALDWWRGYFTTVAGSRFLMGRAPPNREGRTFRADLEWLTRPNNFAKVIEGKYSGDRQ